MSPQRTMVLDHDGVQRKIERIAHQLHEENFEEASILLVGVADRGATLAKRLAARLIDISEMEVDLAELRLDKDAPHAHEIKLTIPGESLEGRTVVLVDDVLMSGRTLMHAAAHLVRIPLKKLTTTVLVDRRHRAFPIRADIVGLTLSSTLQEHISVEFGKRDAIYLS